MSTQHKLMTADEVLLLPEDGGRYELVRGELQRMPPPNLRHEEVAASFLLTVGAYVKANKLGRVYGAPGFILDRDPDTVRAPDFAFVAAHRIEPGPSPQHYLDIAPDLVAEVVSPGDSASHIQDRITMWLEAEVPMVVILYPDSATATVYRSPTDVRLLGLDDTFDGADVLLGFSCPLKEFFPE